MGCGTRGDSENSSNKEENHALFFRSSINFPITGTNTIIYQKKEEKKKKNEESKRDKGENNFPVLTRLRQQKNPFSQPRKRRYQNGYEEKENQREKRRNLKEEGSLVKPSIRRWRIHSHKNIGVLHS